MQPKEDDLTVALDELVESPEEGTKEYSFDYRKKIKRTVIYREQTLCDMFRMKPTYDKGNLYAGSRFYRSTSENKEGYSTTVSFAHQEFPWCCGALAIYGIQICGLGGTAEEQYMSPHSTLEMAIFLTQIIHNMLHNNNMVVAVSMINTDSSHAGWALKKAGWKMDINRHSKKHNYAYFNGTPIEDYIYPIILATKTGSENKVIINPDNYRQFEVDEIDEDDDY